MGKSINFWFDESSLFRINCRIPMTVPPFPSFPNNDFREIDNVKAEGQFYRSLPDFVVP